MNSTSLEKLRALSLVSATLEMEYAMPLVSLRREAARRKKGTHGKWLESEDEQQ